METMIIAVALTAWFGGLILAIGCSHLVIWMLLEKVSKKRGEQRTDSAADNSIYYLESALASLICYILSSYLCFVQ